MNKYSSPAIFADYPELFAGVTLRTEPDQPPYLDQNYGFKSFPSEQIIAERRSASIALRHGLASSLSPTAAISLSTQEHGNRIISAHQGDIEAKAVADGIITGQPDILIGVLLADCAGMLAYDPKAKIIGAAHSGWRGTRANIAKQLVAAMQRAGANPQDTLAYISPTACARHYEVGQEFHDYFDTRYLHKANGKLYFDNSEAIADQLSAEGVAAIETDTRCTIEDKTLHSHRRDAKNAGRFMAFIGLRT